MYYQREQNKQNVMIITPPDMFDTADKVEIPKMFDTNKQEIAVVQPIVAKNKIYFLQRLKLHVQALRHALQPRELWQHFTWLNIKRLASKYALITCTIGASIYIIQALSPLIIKDTRPNSLSQNISQNNVLSLEEISATTLKESITTVENNYSEEEDLLLKDLKSIAIIQQTAFLERFAKVAQSEMQKYDVPASIILGLSIAYTRFGTNALALQQNNYFAMQCSENKAESIGVIGQTDEKFNPNFCFNQFENAWSSYRTHTLLLKDEKYAQLAEMAKGDYVLWARGLEELGYRQQNNGFSSESLQAIIRNFNLMKYDKP